jgi:hypothetical protein
MADFKILGDSSPIPVNEIGQMTQGLGYPLRSVDQASATGLTPIQEERLNGMGMYIRKTDDYTILPASPFIRLDIFPSADGIVVTLPDPSLVPYQWAVFDIFNQTDDYFNLIVKDHLGATLQTLAPLQSLSAFFDLTSSPVVSPWEFVSLAGITTPNLDVALFGDMNSINYNNLQTPFFTITGLGNQYFNTPFTLLALSSYTFRCGLLNTADAFIQTLVMTTNSDFSNTGIGRQAIRAGLDFGSAQSVGWRVSALTTDP